MLNHIFTYSDITFAIGWLSFFCSLTPDMIIKSSIGYSVIKHTLGFYFIKNIVDRNAYNKIQKWSVYIIPPAVLVSRQILLPNPHP